MRKLQVFFSSVQNEFADYRKELAEYIVSDKLLGQFFEPVLFENLSASDQRTDEVYLDLVSKCDIFLCLLGLQYGFENDKGISPTESEFMQAELANRNRIVFIQGNHEQRHPKMQKLVSLAESQLIRRRITNIVDLKTNVYSSFVQILMKRGYIQTAPFDSAIQRQSSMDDIDENRVRRFVALAQTKRGFPLSDQSTLTKLLTHLNLLRENQPTNAALLLFGRYPQSFFTSSIVKCAQFHGTEISKPIPAHRDFNGDIFELIDQAVDFVLSRIDISTGTRNESNDVPINYEIPRAVIVEAIVNAVVHRDYTSEGSVQVMLFSDRLEIWNPGFLPPNLSINQLKRPHASFPANPLLAEPMYQVGYIERMGTGTGDMIRECLLVNLPEPLFLQEDMFKTVIWRKFTPQVTPQVQGKNTSETFEYQSCEIRLLCVISGDMSRQTLMDLLGLKDKKNFRENYLKPALKNAWIEMTNSNAQGSNQAYKLTRKGKLNQKKYI